MATKTTPAPSLLDAMEVVDHLDVPMRGRTVSADTVLIREQLEECELEGKARSFTGVTKETRENFARKIRAAATMKGKPTIKVGTRFIESEGKLIWGPQSVLDQLQSK